MSKKLGLVTVLYHSESVLEDFFISLKSQSFQDFKLYLVDNSASDKSTDFITGFLSQDLKFEFEHIIASDNLGVAEGNNVGIRKSIEDQCEYTILLNNDIIIEQKELLEKIAEYHLNQKYEIIVPKIFYPDKRTIWFAGGYFDKLRALGVHVNYKKIDRYEIIDNTPITYSPTCFMSIQNQVFKKVGIMDSKYFVYTDDTDFVYRCTQIGIKVWYTPSLEIIHKISTSTGGDESNFYIYYSNRNKIYFIRKHFSGFHKLISITYHLMARIVFYFKFNSSQRVSLIRGLKDGFKLN